MITLLLFHFVLSAMLTAKVVNTCRRDEGRQRCRIGPNFFKELKVKLGDYIRIDLNDQRYTICKAFCRQDKSDAFTSFDATVLSCTDVWQHDTTPTDMVGKCIEISTMKKLRVGNATVVLLRVVSKRHPNVFEKKSHAVLSSLKQVLTGCCVTESVRVNFDEKTKAAFNVHCVHVEAVEGDSDESDAFVITDSTVIRITSAINENLWTQISNGRIKEVYSYDHVIEKLESMFFHPTNHASACGRLGIRASSGIMLAGPSGVGKTSLVHFFCKKFKIYLMKANASSILRSDPGDSELELRRLFRSAQTISTQCPCILFFDQIETICGKRNQRNHSSRLLTQMLTLLDGVKNRGSMAIFAATSQPNAIDPALRRPGRFDLEINMNVPNESQRREILQNYFQSVEHNGSIDFDAIAMRTRGYTGADLELLFVNAVFDTLKHCRGDSARLSDSNLMNAMKVKPSHEQTSDFIVEAPKVMWSDIGGLSEVKSKIKQVIEWPLLQRSAFRRLGLKRPNGILLFGPPGCSKTMLVRAAATACNVSFISASAAHIFSPFVGDSESLISDAFRQARNSMPCILFFDEIDSLAGSRSTTSRENNVQQRILSTLLNEMDGIGTAIDEIPGYGSSDVRNDSGDGVEMNGVLFVAATNRPDLLDDALIRPGRLDRVLYVPPPNRVDRIDILKSTLAKIPNSNIEVQIIADRTEKFSGADLVGVCREACLLAMERDISEAVVQNEDFDVVLRTAKPSITSKQLDFYTKYIADHSFVM